jgi:hypothetical protein
MNTNNRVVHPVNNPAKLGIEDTMLKIDGWNTGLNGTVGVSSCVWTRAVRSL